MSVIHIENDDHYKSFFTENEEKVIVVDFTASWCGPCKLIAPLFDELAAQFPNMVFLKVDVDECEETASDVSAMPTFRFFKNGEKVDEFKGGNEEKLKELCAKYGANETL